MISRAGEKDSLSLCNCHSDGAKRLKNLKKMTKMARPQCHSLIDVADCENRRRARDLLSNGQVHFIGSDSHRIDHRPPSISAGVKYILKNVESAYADKIPHENSTLLLENPK